MLNPETAGLLSDQDVIDRLFQHIDKYRKNKGPVESRFPHCCCQLNERNWRHTRLQA